jgi:hypothetical protein
LRAVLRGERLLPASEVIEIVRCLSHDRVLAALGTARWIDLDGLLPQHLLNGSSMRYDGASGTNAPALSGSVGD